MVDCFIYTKTSVNVLSIIISLILTAIFAYVFLNTNGMSLFARVETTKNTEEKIEEVYQEKGENTNNELWQIQIPKIDLIADISEGTSQEILNKYVGHFEGTQKENGNVGLAAHNRGYDVNYFARLKELGLGDEIIYIVNGNKKEYEISLITIIEDTEWTNLENTNDNRLTLITCLENEPSKRRCIQAKEKEKK